MSITPLPTRMPKSPRDEPNASRQFNAAYATNNLAMGVYRPIRGAWNTSWLLNSKPSLETQHLRRLSAWGLPGLCTSTLLHQVEGLKWKIVNPDGEYDDVTKYYGKLFHGANDLKGGSNNFLMRCAADVLACKTGSFIEIPRNDAGVPVALYNTDGATFTYTHDPVWPYAQVFLGQVYRKYPLEEVLQLIWRPFTDFDMEGYNLSPIQIIYNAIFILASGDDYNRRLLSDDVPSGLLNLGESFDRKTALEWKAVWDGEMASDPRLAKLGILWGSSKIDFQPFSPPPRDMAFSETAFWQATMVCAGFELSPLDIGIGISRVTTGAAAEQQATIAKRQGLTALLRKMAKGFERHILPEGYSMVFEDIDRAAQRDRAAVGQMEAQAIGNLVQSLGPEAGLMEAQAKGVLSSPRSMQAAIKWVEAQQAREQANKEAELAVADKKASMSGAGKDQTSNTSSPKRDNGSKQD